jgi:nucleoside-diphosphate-sugar epimerase
MNILITGIHGFVGSNLAISLVDHTVYGVSTHSQEKNAHTVYSWDELNEIPEVDVVIHLAGKAHDTRNQTEAQTYFVINTGLTQKIFDWFLQSDARKFVFFSSVKAAANTVEGTLTEDCIPSPKGPYGESKRAAEEYIKTTKNGVDKQVYILRPCMIHGPGNKGNLNLLYSMIRKGIPWPLGSFDNKRSFASIDNVAFIINQLIEQDISSGIYNLADDESLSTNEIIQIMCATISRTYTIWNIPKKLINAGAALGSILYFPLNRERLEKLTENYIVSNEKIKKVLGISALPVSAKEGLIKTIRSFEIGNNLQ